MRENYADKSRGCWSTNDGSNPNIEQLKFGCLQRIATACEAMAKDHLRLERECDRQIKRATEYYKLWQAAERSLSATHGMVRSLSATRGMVTKLKKQLAKGKGKSP